jgi:ABC-type sugar transport system permease subunit
MEGLVYWWRKNDRKTAPYLFLTPFLILFTVFSIYPVFYSVYLSFHKVVGLSTPTFVGLENYVDLAKDPRFIKSLVNTSYYAAASVFILSPLALLVAVAFDAKVTRNLSHFYQVTYFLPIITSAVVVATMFRMIFDEQYGLLNGFLMNFGMEGVPWLRSTRWALPSIFLMGIWLFLGINALYFLAGLQNISHEIKEAAQIDGANSWQTFFYVMVPLLKPVILFVIIQAIIGSYNLFAQPLLLTGGGPQDATLMMTIYLYIKGFREFRLGYAAAIGYAIVFIVLILTVINLFLFRTFREDV